MPTTGIIGNKLSFEKRLVKLSSGPQTTLGLIITVFLKFSSAFCSPKNFDFWYKDGGQFAKAWWKVLAYFLDTFI